MDTAQLYQLVHMSLSTYKKYEHFQRRNAIYFYIGYDWIHVFYPVRQQVSQQGSQRNKNVF